MWRAVAVEATGQAACRPGVQDLIRTGCRGLALLLVGLIASGKGAPLLAFGTKRKKDSLER